MNWTKEKPTKQGYYWWRQYPSTKPRIAKVWGYDGECEYVAWMGTDNDSNLIDTEGEWFGPIEPPSD